MKRTDLTHRLILVSLGLALLAGAVHVVFAQPPAGPAVAGEWRGEWGVWSRPDGRTLRGGSVLISDCNETRATCRLRAQAESGRSSYAGFEAGVELRITSPTTAAAQLEDYEPRPRDCRLDLTMTRLGRGRSLRARLTGKECGALYPNRRAYFPATLPFVSTKPFPWYWTRDCIADARASRRTWCLDPGLLRQDGALETKALEIPDLLDRNAPRERFEAARESILARCEHASDIPGCLHAGYAALGAEVERDRTAAQAAYDRDENELEKPGDPAQGARLVTSLRGVYKRRFPNALVDGTKFTSENILEIVPVGEDGFYFRTLLEFYNGHTCSLHGVAHYTAAGRFLFEDSTANLLPDEPRCRLQLAAQGKEIQLLDPGESCRRYCGARGHLDGISFPLSVRRPILYLARLERSKEYREAVGSGFRSGPH